MAVAKVEPTKSTGDRNELKRRTREVLTKEASFIPNPSFRDMDASGFWKSELSQTQARESMPAPSSTRFKMPAHLERLCETPLLSPDEERDLFRRMNYLKYRANSLRSTLNENRPSSRKLDQIEALFERAEAIRNEIVSANIRLIISIVRKFADDSSTFDDMLSEGINSLMNAVEKFDYDRGFRFSTYATLVVRREIYRTIQRSHKRGHQFVTGQTETLNDQENTRGTEADSSAFENVDGYIAEMLERLDEREKFIVSARYGFIDLGMKATFSNLGRKLGISKERVRQLELRAVEKLRNVIGELGVFNELRSVVSR